MQLHYLLAVVVVSDMSNIKVLSSTVAQYLLSINYSAITRVVNNYNIGTEPHFFEPNSFRTESEFFSKTERK